MGNTLDGPEDGADGEQPGASPGGAGDTGNPASPEPSEQGQGAAGTEEPRLALVAGQAVTELPTDLYIPPHALEVFLGAFEGPLDFLLYLIRRQNIDILEIDVSDITEQYMRYIDLMDAMQFELAAEYLLMAAVLTEIKSRMLLPRSGPEEEEEEDPRAQLIRRLQEYERFKQAAEDLNELPRVERDTFIASAEPPPLDEAQPLPDVDLRELLVALVDVMRRADMYEHHHVQRETLSTRERMSEVLDTLRGGGFVPFISLFRVEEGRLGVIVTFLAIMELMKESLVEVVQTADFGPIHLKAASGSVELAPAATTAPAAEAAPAAEVELSLVGGQDTAPAGGEEQGTETEDDDG